MEKFAVDLDKVLDDFELNEDRAERFAAKNRSPLAAKSPQLPSPQHQQAYLGRLRDSRKRDSRYEGSERLRRINLLDADFAPDPIPTHVHFGGDQANSTSTDGPFHPSQVVAASPSHSPLPLPVANGESGEEAFNDGDAVVVHSSPVGSPPTDPVVGYGFVSTAVESIAPCAEEGAEPSEGDSVQDDAEMAGVVPDTPESDSECAQWKPTSLETDGCSRDAGFESSSEDVLNNGGEGTVEMLLPSDSNRPVGESVGVHVPCSDVVAPSEAPFLHQPPPLLEEPIKVGGEEGSGVADEGEPTTVAEIRPVRFQVDEELSDAEFAKYLEELEGEVGKNLAVDGTVGQSLCPGVEGEEEEEVAVGIVVVAEGEVMRTKSEDCREEAWEEEGSGSALLDGATSTPIAPQLEPSLGSAGEEEGSPPCVVEGQKVAEQGRAGPSRPDSLPLGDMVSGCHSTALMEEDDDSSIPIPLVIGPPGATPANPRPPSGIAEHEPVTRVLESTSNTPLPPTKVAAAAKDEHDVGGTSSPPENEVVGALSAPAKAEESPSSSSGGQGEGVVGGSAEALPADDNEDGDDESLSPASDLVTRHIEADGTGLVSALEGSSVASGIPQLVSDVEAVEESRLSHGSTLALGDVAPFWVPDADAPACMLCMAKFTLIKRRHHCRACGKVLCSKCCSSRARLAYMDHSEARVCAPCQSIIQEAAATPLAGGQSIPSSGRGQGGGSSQEPQDDLISVDPSSPRRRPGAAGRPDPNNPMEYCSTVPPLEQVGERARAPPPSVMVPVGVLKREGSSSSRSKGEVKQVMFSDGIRPGGELSDLDISPNVSSTVRGSTGLSAVQRKIANRLGKRLPGMGPPEYNFEEGPELDRLMDTLMDESEPPLAFALSKNFFVLVKIITLDCCVNRVVWSFTTRGMRCVGQDEVVVLLEWLPSDKGPPRDIFCHLTALYEQASKGNTVTELGHSTVQGVFLGTHNHGGFLYIRATFQCLRRLPLPPPPYLFALLLHRMETPWAKVFPIRVMLRLGAQFRYYPCPLVGVRGREPVYHQIGHTIMNLLSDFRNFAYILPSVRGMVIHMEERQTSILLPRNRLSQVERALDDSDDHVLALAASFSSTADSHLVCVQGEEGGGASTGGSHYHTQAINIQNKPRKVTGASFVVFNGALKVSAKVTAKSSIVEDGLMVQVLPDTLVTLRNALRNGEDFVIPCGPVSPTSPPAPPPPVAPAGAEIAADGKGSPGTELQPNAPDEVVIIRWTEDDKNFNIGVKSPIDGMALDGVPSIRVHNGTNYVSDTKFIRWTEVFLIQQSNNEALPSGRGDAVDVSRISESIAHAVCLALHPYLDLLWSHALTLIAVRATLGPDSEGYEAGCGGSRLPPIYMNSLDNELVGVLHRIESRPQEGSSNSPLVLELLFHLMEL
ncbi:zinc finger FYVE domain-containing protein 16 isoform X2 [Hetaerina americana]|uniref:zinc finger FYVE domain-containing protein 16 isoform X2 n=1 Tax=Hetaerina americana TaxID=62018 RepID=UPI003A7F1A71